MMRALAAAAGITIVSVKVYAATQHGHIAAVFIRGAAIPPFAAIEKTAALFFDHVKIVGRGRDIGPIRNPA